MAALLQLKNVSKSYASVAGAAPVRVLDDITLVIDAGTSAAITGPSGSGKSTLLNIMGTLDRPTSGSIQLGGRDVAGLDEPALAQIRNAEIGFVFQSHHLLPQCTVLENVLVPTLASTDAARRSAAPERAKRLLERVGLGGRLDHVPGKLSGGERQRVAVVRALINGPQLLLADEPTGALDGKASGELACLLLELNREERVTLVVVTHAPDLAARMGRVIALRDGKVV